MQGKRRFFTGTEHSRPFAHSSPSRIGLTLLIIAFLFFGCERSSVTPGPSEGNPDDGGDNNNPPSGILWDGTSPSAWVDAVTIDGSTVNLPGEAGSLTTTRAISVRSIQSAIFTFDLDFESDLTPRTFSFATSVKKTDGDANWYPHELGGYFSSDPATGVSVEVYNSTWRLDGVEIDSIRLRFGSFNQNLPVYLVNPIITAP